MSRKIHQTEYILGSAQTEKMVALEKLVCMAQALVQDKGEAQPSICVHIK
jgi:hypothetical protein